MTGCPSGYYEIDNYCKVCPANCVKCGSDGKCLACADTYILNVDSVCSRGCRDGLYLTVDNICL